MIPVASRLLRVWRKRSGKTQGECASLAEVRQATWSEYESGKTTPRTTVALKIAEIAGRAVPIEQWGVFESDEEHARDLALGEEPIEEAPPDSSSNPKPHEEAS